MTKEIAGVKMYSLPEIADQLNVTVFTLREYCKIGKLKGKILGGSWMVSEDHLKEFLNTPDQSPQRGAKYMCRKVIGPYRYMPQEPKYSRKKRIWYGFLQRVLIDPKLPRKSIENVKYEVGTSREEVAKKLMEHLKSEEAELKPE